MKLQNLKLKQKAFLLILTAAIFLPVFAGEASAAAPANDNLANAQTISGASGTTNGSTADATRENLEFNHTGDNGIKVYRTVGINGRGRNLVCFEIRGFATQYVGFGASDDILASSLANLTQ